MVLLALLSWNSINLFLCFTAFSNISVVTPPLFFFTFGSKPQNVQAPSGSAWHMIFPQLRQLPWSGCSTAWQLHLTPPWFSLFLCGSTDLFGRNFFERASTTTELVKKMQTKYWRIFTILFCRVIFVCCSQWTKNSFYLFFIEKTWDYKFRYEIIQLQTKKNEKTHLVIVVIFKFPLCCSTTVGASGMAAGCALAFFPFFLPAPADQNSSSSSSPFLGRMITSSGIYQKFI